MATTRTVTAKAEAGKMTLDEVAAFVQAAMRDGTGGDATVRARATVGGWLKELSVDVHSAATSATLADH